MASNGNPEQTLQRLVKSETERAAIASSGAKAPESTEQFTLARFGEFLAHNGMEKQAITREYAERLLDLTRRELVYLEQIVGRLK